MCRLPDCVYGAGDGRDAGVPTSEGGVSGPRSSVDSLFVPLYLRCCLVKSFWMEKMRRQSRLNQRGCTLSNLPRIDNPIESWHHKLNGAIHTYLIVFRLIKTMRTTDDRGPETPPSLVGTPASRPSPAPTHQSTGVGSQLSGSQLSGESIVRESVVRGVSCPGVSCPESIVRESVVQESVVRIPTIRGTSAGFLQRAKALVSRGTRPLESTEMFFLWNQYWTTTDVANGNDFTALHAAKEPCGMIFIKYFYLK